MMPGERLRGPDVEDRGRPLPRTRRVPRQVHQRALVRLRLDRLTHSDPGSDADYRLGERDPAINFVGDVDADALGVSLDRAEPLSNVAEEQEHGSGG